MWNNWLFVLVAYYISAPIEPNERFAVLLQCCFVRSEGFIQRLAAQLAVILHLINETTVCS